MRQAVHEEIVLQADSVFWETQMRAPRKNLHPGHHLLVIFCVVIKPVWVESFLKGSNSPEACPVQTSGQMRHVEIFLAAHFGHA